MSTLAIDTYRLLTALTATGKNANFSADEIANPIGVAQEGAELLTLSVFDARMAAFDARMTARMDAFDARMTARIDAFEARMHAFDVKLSAFDVKLDALRADIKTEVKASQLQNLLWLSGIMLASNGAVIALLGRAARLF